MSALFISAQPATSLLCAPAGAASASVPAAQGSRWAGWRGWLLLVCALALFVVAQRAEATQWKWRDPGGRIQYSDLPPPSSVPDKDILKRPAAPPARQTGTAPAGSDAAASKPASAATPTRNAGKAADPELEERKRKADEAKQAEAKAEEAKRAQERAEACERARGYQRALDDGIRIGRTNAKGEREILDDQARAQETARNRQLLDTHCR